MSAVDLFHLEHLSVQSRLREHRQLLLVCFDVAAIALSYLIVTLVRYPETSTPPWRGVSIMAATAIGVHLALAHALKIYRGRSLVASPDETVRLGMVAVAAAAITQVVNLIGPGQLGARALPLGAAGVSLGLMAVSRAAWRRWTRMPRQVITAQSRPTVVIGAGESGRQLVASMHGHVEAEYVPVAFIDDDEWKQHLEVDGVRVFGRLSDLECVIANTGATQVVVAIPSIGSHLLSEIQSRSAALGVSVKMLPPVSRILGGAADIRDVRDIDVSDVLGRGAIDTDVDAVAGYLRGKRVLVTGAGGSIGSELCRQIAKWNPAELMMHDRDESGLHGVQLSITGQALLDSDDVILADIRDLEVLTQIFGQRRPEVVFHAAALKHLPMLEQYPDEAVKTNVIGTANLLQVCTQFDVERFVNISTDKAADPTSVLGYSKRAAERLTADEARQRPGAWMSVRFGNVLGSRGSVLTTFAAQIAAGGPVTVTHPDVTRYFMTVAEAVQLVLQAGAIGQDGEVLILDMGEPVRIDDVARRLIAQSGRQIEVIYTGLREGEKLDEILIAGTETDARPVHPLISHVHVEPLPARQVRDELLTRTCTGDELLRRWCALHTVDVPTARMGSPRREHDPASALPTQ